MLGCSSSKTHKYGIMFPKLFKQLIIFLTLQNLTCFGHNDEGLHSVWTSESCSMVERDHGSCSKAVVHRKCKRYVTYDINRGEGFNLRRDIYVRIAPIISRLNRLDSECEWVLVLHPWGWLPHWKDAEFYPWSTYFQLDQIQQYIPSIEYQHFLDESLQKNHLDAYFQLQHFPLNDPISEDWFQNVKANVTCESKLKFAKDISSGLYTGTVWDSKWTADEASCMAVKGFSSHVAHFLLHFNSTYIMLDRAEVILWDHYAGAEWWEARKSLHFSLHLISIAHKWLLQNFSPNFQKENRDSASFLAIHLRRKDFVTHKPDPLSLPNASCTILKFLQQMSHIHHVFIATDGSQEEILELQSLVRSSHLEKKHVITFLKFNCHEYHLSEGECAIIDQIIASWSFLFIGTRESTFTLRIFEEREIMEISPDLNYHVFSNNCKPHEPSEKATRWPVI